MTTTRPGYIWSGSEWVAIGQEAVVAPVKYQATAPTSPATGDIWIDSDDDVPGIDTSQFLRWRKTMAGGETSVSGSDDNNLTLKYTPNYEQVYLNGVLLVRGQDYTATNGTSITGLTALAANDVVEVFGVVARTVGDVYTQAQSDSKYATTVNFPAGAWTSWTPTITAQTGTITSTTVQFARYVQFGKTVHIRCGFTITNNGTGAGDIRVSLPVSTNGTGQSVGAGREIANTGNMIQVLGTGSLAILANYNNTYPGATNYQIHFSLTYEAA